ncbi:MAG: DUF1853 family protein [Pseudomonadales bacterium]|nr:DUF1853 family protein [Pseudomonadales bacterium]MCP5215130.1 DUF1853 family protein [Pseudomonadales bacterium]
MSYQITPQQMCDDLVWAVTSPHLMALSQNLTTIPAPAELYKWLTTDKHKERLSQYLTESKPTRLGVYFEILWRYFLEQHPSFELVSHNLPVRNNGQTLGEFDFIYYCRQRQRYIHLETAVKFYLGRQGNSQTPSSWAQWIGPGCKDRLDIKLAHMLGKQSQLSLTPEGAELISVLSITNLRPEICLKGYFFYPLEANCAAPKQCATTHLRGYWLKRSQLEFLPPMGLWKILDKPSWLSPAHHVEEREVLDHAALEKNLAAYFAVNQFPLMLVLLAPEQQCFNEQARYFVTQDYWPDLHS